MSAKGRRLARMALSRLRGRRGVLAAAGAALVIGGIAGWISTLRSGPAQRPPEVEALLRAVESTQAPLEARRATIARALSAAGDPGRFETPWREDVEFGRLAAAGDLDG